MCIYITGEKPYKCTFEGCDRAFAQMANLHHHMRNHDEHVRKAASKQFHCMICHRAYTNESSLKNHTLKVNTSKQFHCMICHRAYTNESSLKNHTLKVNVQKLVIKNDTNDIYKKLFYIFTKSYFWSSGMEFGGI